MRSRELQVYLASITGRPLSEIDQRLRRLREHTKITTGPRGNAAPHMTEAEALFHILSLVSRRPSDAFEVADNLFSRLALVPSPTHPGLSDPFPGKELAMFMMMTMRGDLRAAADFDVRSFELDESGGFAVMNFDRRSLKGLRFFFRDDASNVLPHHIEGIYRSVDTLSASSRFVIGVDHLEAIGKMISITGGE